MNSPQLLLIAHERTDARVGRRVRAFADHGWQVLGASFHRPRPGRSDDVPWENIHLGETRDRAYVRRLFAIVAAIFVLWGQRDRLRHVAAFYVINSDNAFIALALRMLLGRRIPLFLEIADIQPPFVGHGAVGKALRWLERRVLARTECLVTTSPGFVRHYFEPLQGWRGRTFLLENKVYPGQPLVQSRRPAPAAGPPWVIGWFGALRCARSWEIIRQLARELPDLVRFELRGYPTAIGAEAFFAEVATFPNIRFGGAYRYPDDLAEMHAPLHFVWAFDFHDASANSRWLLPNRLYESGLFHVPVLAAEGTETGAWTRRHAAGAVFPPESLADALREFLTGLDAEKWTQLRAATAARADEASCGEADYQALSDLMRPGAVPRPAGAACDSTGCGACA